MADKLLSGRIVAVMLANGFNEIEFTEPQKSLIEAGATTKVVSRANGLVNGWYEDSWGHFFPVDVDLAETLSVDYDGLIIPGGMHAIDKMIDDPHSQRILKAFMRASMPTIIVGDAGRLLARTEIVHGLTVTSSVNVREELEANGAIWKAAPFVVEDALVTVNGIEGVRDAMKVFVTIVDAYDKKDLNAA
ncbi:peptidase C56, PfpI [Candidatus Endolissoclinum faulkneri L5]|uniref:Peptidase C56, PfpI n=1 Tax=Candidatus Endolissoclinum faulkneri L5 TaxID=1401328 RepID=V9TVR3_9PROT|nr:DJ-1/PfpI family protein [Candidatus Endolissoclinum faulkneri]AHC73788.1 peptidase C56, PfpI [Candidatus Endolissoclinum faulkneri L5]